MRAWEREEIPARDVVEKEWGSCGADELKSRKK
jgi:hypothetical protein